jgi:hypothetical protein
MQKHPPLHFLLPLLMFAVATPAFADAWLGPEALYLCQGSLLLRWSLWIFSSATLSRNAFMVLCPSDAALEPSDKGCGHVANVEGALMIRSGSPSH